MPTNYRALSNWPTANAKPRRAGAMVIGGCYLWHCQTKRLIQADPARVRRTRALAEKMLSQDPTMDVGEAYTRAARAVLDADDAARRMG